MPTYRYRCAKCDDEFEEWQSFDEKPLAKHRGCGGKLAKVLSTPGIVLKGSGFYRTDNRNGSSTTSKRSDSSKSESGDASSSGDSSSGATSDSTSDSKSGSKSGAEADTTKSGSSA